jgi:hypothetical protein
MGDGSTHLWWWLASFTPVYQVLHNTSYVGIAPRPMGIQDDSKAR